jgi:hypothetical protein
MYNNCVSILCVVCMYSTWYMYEQNVNVDIVYVLYSMHIILFMYIHNILLLLNLLIGW